MSSTERSARLRAEKVIQGFSDSKPMIGKSTASFAASKAAKAGTWIGMADLLEVLPRASKPSEQKATIRAWFKAIKRSKAGGKGQGAQVAQALLDVGSDVLSDPGMQAALTSAGVPPQVASGLAGVFDSLSASLGPEAAAQLTGEVTVALAEEPSSPEGLLDRAVSAVQADPGGYAAKAAITVAAGLLARRVL